ncbi:hypothetical protein [Kurthia gibsonii]|uniref:hypothetical protein n=1 Tax=Kurthia gibsonii TaxID=33946 RepID=UPI0031B6D8E5
MNNNWGSLSKESRKRLLTARAVDENGEVIEGVQIVLTQKYTQEQREFSQDREILNSHAKNSGGFVRAFYAKATSIDATYPDLKKEDLARLLFLSTYIQYETNQIRYENGRAISREQLCELLQMQARRFNEFLDRAIAADFLSYDEEESIFCMNDERFYRGSSNRHAGETKDLASVRIYRNTIRDLYNDYCKTRALATLSLVYRVLPYVSYATNVLSHNPESDAGEIKPIDVTELQQIFSYSTKQKMVQALQKIRLKDEPLFLIVDNPHDLKKQRVIMNTRVVFAGKGKHLDSINVLFNK